MNPATTIETWGEQPDPDLKNWRDTVPGIGHETPKRAADDILEYCLREKHHQSYGRPWCDGRSNVDHLIELGLSPADTVLDFGCGVGRNGIWLIGYLNCGSYFGVDSHRRSLDAFAQYEIPLHGLAPKAPRLVHDAWQQFEKFGVTFDWILDFAASIHMAPEYLPTYYQRAIRVLKPNGRLVMTMPHETPPPAALSLEGVHSRPSSFVKGEVQDFHIFRRA